MPKKVQPITESKPSLAERMGAITTATAPNLNPNFSVTPPPAKEKEIIPDLKDLVEQRKDYLELKRLITTSLELAEQERLIKKQRDPISSRIKDLLGTYKIGKAQVEGCRVNYFSGERRSIDASLLLANGVQPRVIEASTKVSVVYTLKITSQENDDD